MRQVLIDKCGVTKQITMVTMTTNLKVNLSVFGNRALESKGKGFS